MQLSIRYSNPSNKNNNQKKAFKLSALLQRIIKKGKQVMQINVTTPKETFIPGRFYQSASGSVLFVTPRTAPSGNTNIMQFYGVKNSKPSTWVDRAMDNLDSAGGRFELLEEGTKVDVELAA